MIYEKWQVLLLNGIEVKGNGTSIQRFRGRPAIELLAYLVVNSHRFVPREELAGVILPDSTEKDGRAGIRTALSSLRSQLEPPGVPSNTVLIADRTSVRISPTAFVADVLEFATAARKALSAPTHNDAADITDAINRYRGEFLPGHYTDWVLNQRSDYRETYRNLLQRLMKQSISFQTAKPALPYVRQYIEENPEDEAAYALGMTVCLLAETPDVALELFDKLQRAMREEYDEEPSQTLIELANQAKHSLSINGNVAYGVGACSLWNCCQLYCS